ncbi:STOREKEEPER protein-like [Typha angustifolia]|uniref:STOREKEEPER protein-like n=1 Tax=Typha angustifolia TaxID=59011 RepID=UPI003C2E78B4
MPSKRSASKPPNPKSKKLKPSDSNSHEKSADSSPQEPKSKISSPSSQPSPTPSRKSERKRKPREFPDTAAGSSNLASQKLWTEADEVALLTGAATFRSRTGLAPRRPDMREFYESIKGLISPHLGQDKVYYKLKRLKGKFMKTTEPRDEPHEQLVYKLSAELWGSEDDNEEEEEEEGNGDADAVEEAENGVEEDEEREEGEEEGNSSCPLLRDALVEYWKANPQYLSGFSLEKGLKLIEPSEAKRLEVKWRKQLEAELVLQMKRHEIFKEVYGLLIKGLKGMGP